MEEPIAYKDEHGIWIYNRLPNGMRNAKKEDFYNEDNDLLLGKKFLAQSFHFPRFEAHEVRPNFIEKWEYWLIHNQIFIKNY